MSITIVGDYIYTATKTKSVDVWDMSLQIEDSDEFTKFDSYLSSDVFDLIREFITPTN